jgi:hypothetical protein
MNLVVKLTTPTSEEFVDFTSEVDLDCRSFKSEPEGSSLRVEDGLPRNDPTTLVKASRGKHIKN